MKLNGITTASLLALTLGASTTVTQGAQARRPAGSAASSVTVKVALKAGGQSLTSSGTGSCTHADQASIYNVMSQMWTVRQQGEGGSTQLTLWRPVDGKEDMFSLSVNGAKDIAVSTVRGGTVTGAGTVKFQAKEKGGTFTIDAKAKTGEAVTGTIECSAFTAAIAEGGDN